MAESPEYEDQGHGRALGQGNVHERPLGLRNALGSDTKIRQLVVAEPTIPGRVRRPLEKSQVRHSMRGRL